MFHATAGPAPASPCPCLCPALFRPCTIQFNQAKQFSRASPVACTWLLPLFMLLLFLLLLLLLLIATKLWACPTQWQLSNWYAAYTHGLSEWDRDRISLWTAAYVLSLFFPLSLSPLFTSSFFCFPVIFACFMSRADVTNPKKKQNSFLTLSQIKVTTAAVVTEWRVMNSHSIVCKSLFGCLKWLQGNWDSLEI